MEVKNDTNENNQELSDNRIKCFIEMIAIKKDSHMTRIYSCISKPDLNSQSNPQEKNKNNDSNT